MTQALTPAPVVHRQVVRRSVSRRFLGRPEVGSLVGAVAVFVMFFSVAEPFRNAASLSTVLYASSTIGIMTVAVSLLMIAGSSTSPPASR